MNNYKILGRAGEGAHGFVFKGTDIRSDKLVALKKINFNPDLGIPKNTMREICALRALRSKYIVEMFEVTAMGSAVVLVMEYLPCSLSDVIKNNELHLTLPQIKTYTKNILNGIDFMHQRKVMHRDIKPANLLISADGFLKVADFGLARIYNAAKPRTYSHQVATRWYRAPELLYGSRSYNPSVDIWAVGCILAEMINRKPLFPGETDIEQLAIVLGTLGTPTEETWPGLKELPDYNKIVFAPSVPKNWKQIIPEADEITLIFVSQILLYNGEQRLSAKKALNHEFFLQKPLPAILQDMPQPEDIKVEEPPWNLDGFDEILNQIK